MPCDRPLPPDDHISFLTTASSTHEHGTATTRFLPLQQRGSEVHIGKKTIRSIALPWASERFFQEGGNSGFFQRQPKRFFHGGPKLVKFHFTHSKPRKKLFL